MEKYIVYTEITENNNIERWFYGLYDYETANEVATELNDNCNDNNCWRCVCTREEAQELEVLNLPY